MKKQKLSVRTEMLIGRYLEVPSILNTERALLLSRIRDKKKLYKGNGLVEDSEEFYFFMAEMSSYIGDYELIVGSQSSIFRGAVFHTREDLDKPSLFSFLADKENGYIDYMPVINQGFISIVEKFSDEVGINDDDFLKGDEEYYHSSILTCKGAMAFTHNMIHKVNEKLYREPRPYCRYELSLLKSMLSHVISYPARNFHEACQAFYLFQLFVHLDNGMSAIGNMGLDRALYQYYKNDMESGVLTEKIAREIIESLWMKLIEISDVRLNVDFQGFPIFDKLFNEEVDDNDLVTNELSEIFISVRDLFLEFNPALKLKIYKKIVTPKSIDKANKEVSYGCL